MELLHGIPGFRVLRGISFGRVAFHSFLVCCRECFSGLVGCGLVLVVLNYCQIFRYCVTLAL